MSISANHTPRHPVASFVARMHDELDDIVERPMWSMGDDETRHTLVQATRLLARLSATELKVAAHADRNHVGDASGATSAGVWWANHTRMTQAEAHRKIKLAKALEQHGPVAEALAKGDVLVDQDRVITDVVDALPDTVQPGVRDQARDYLLGAAKQLAAEEKRAEEKARLSMHDDGHGQTHGRFTIGNAEADMLRKALQALASPKAGGQGLSPHGMGLALMDYIRRYPTDMLPTAGGVNATVVVTMTMETLMGGLKAAQLDTGTMISPGLARKLACEAGIIVLGGKSEVLDVGRRGRFHTKAQRIAMAVRDQGCVALGCERPTSACQAHHLILWSQAATPR